MIHKSKIQESQYKYGINEKLKWNSLIVLGSLVLLILSAVLVYTDIIPSKEKYNTQIFDAVALVSTPQGTATAFLVGETYMITAHHVISELNVGDEIDVVFNIKEKGVISTTAILAWKDEDLVLSDKNIKDDFAVLKLNKLEDLPDNLKRLQIGVSSEVALASGVLLIGYPNGEFLITEGIISSDDFNSMPMFKLDAGAWPGSSGGPLLNKDTNEVIGILVAGSTGAYQGINIACQIDYVIEKLSSNGINIYD